MGVCVSANAEGGGSEGWAAGKKGPSRVLVPQLSLVPKDRGPAPLHAYTTATLSPPAAGHLHGDTWTPLGEGDHSSSRATRPEGETGQGTPQGTAED